MLGLSLKSSVLVSTSRGSLAPCLGAHGLRRVPAQVLVGQQVRGYAAKNAPSPPSPTAESKGTPREQLPLGTIDHTKLQASDYLDLSGKPAVRVVAPGNSNATCHLRYAAREAWPQGTGGFLYLRTPPPGASLAATSLRFRVTNDRDPASFAAGTDLAADGLPWDAPALTRSGLRALEALAPASPAWPALGALRAQVTRAASHTNSWWRDEHTPILYRQQQPFRIDFSKARVRMWVLGKDAATGADALRQMWWWVPGGWNAQGEGDKERHIPLYTGKGVVCLETSKTWGGSLRAVMRLLKVVEPIVRTGNTDIQVPDLKEGSVVPHVKPEEGLVSEEFTPEHDSHPVHLYATLPTIKED